MSLLARAAGVPTGKPDPKDPAPKPPADIQLDIAGDWSAARPDGGKIGLIDAATVAAVTTTTDKKRALVITMPKAAKR